MFNYRRIRFGILGAMAALGLLSSLGTSTVSASPVTPPSFTALSSRSTLPDCRPFAKFDRNNFSHPLKIDNQFYTLVPGTRFIMDGTINAGTKPTAHRIVFTVTDLTKVINGVRTRVMWDTDMNNGVLAESELAFQAQDDSGNVWVLGEYPEEYDNGKFSGAPFTWITGLGAQAGVLVPGNPQLGTPAFREGFSPRVQFYDCGQVTATGLTITDSRHSYQNVLEVNEWAPPAPNDGYQQKYYAPGVGNVKIGAIDDPQAETMTLTKVVQLSPRALLEARRAALKLDRHGYEVSDIYRQTRPAH